MPGQEEINSFIKEFTGIKKSITLDSDIVVNRIVAFLALLGMIIFLLWKYFYRSS